MTMVSHLNWEMNNESQMSENDGTMFRHSCKQLGL